MGVSVKPDPLLSPAEFARRKKQGGRLILPGAVVSSPASGVGRDFGDAPTIGEQARAGVQAVGHAVTHPVETAKNIVTGMASDLGKTFLAPVEGDENTRNAKTGLLPHPDLQEGAKLTKENTPGILSPEEFQRAGVGTELNAIFMGAPAMSAIPRVGVNAAVGAYYDPEQPVRGAVAGTALGEVMHGAGKLVGAAAKPVPEVDQAAAARASVLSQLGPQDRTFIQNDPRLAPVFMPEREPRLPALPRDAAPEPPNSGPPPSGPPRPPVRPEPPSQGGSVVSDPLLDRGGTLVREGKGLTPEQEALLERMGVKPTVAPSSAYEPKAGNASGLAPMAAAEQDALLRRMGVNVPEEKPALTLLSPEEFAKNPEPMQPSRLKARAGSISLSGRPSDHPFIKQVPGQEHPLAGTKVVDDAGQPKRVYHGTSATFESFDMNKLDKNALYGPGLYFTEDPSVAGGAVAADGGVAARGYTQKYHPDYRTIPDDVVQQKIAESRTTLAALERQRAEALRADPNDTYGRAAQFDPIIREAKLVADEWQARLAQPLQAPNVRPARLAIKNPFDIDAPAASARPQVEEFVKRRIGGLPKDWTPEYRAQFQQRVLGDIAKAKTNGELYDAVTQGPLGGKAELNNFLRAQGYDGITHIGGGNTGTAPHRVWIAFDGEQVRSAFDPAAPRVGAINISGKGNTPRQAKGTPYEAPLDNGADPRLVNVAKLGLSPEGEAQFRSMMPATGEKVHVTHAETEALARELEMDPERLKRRINDWSGAEALAARNVIAQNTERIVALSKQVADQTVPPAERQAAQQEISRLTTDVGTIADRLMGERSKAGRDLNAYKIIAKSTMDPATWLAQAQRVRGAIGLTAEQQTEVLRLTGEKDRAGLIAYISKLHETTPLEKGLALWKAGLLTGLRTHEVNMVSNAAMAAMETVKDIPAAGIDRIASLVTGERSTAPSFRGNIIEAAKGISRGAKAAKAVLRSGDPAQLERWDFRQTNFKSPVLQFYVDAVFRSLGAEDQLARGAAMGRALEEYSRLRAGVLAKADKSKTFAQHLADLRQNPPDDIVVKAIGDAEYATFQNDNAIATGVSALKRSLPSGGRAVAEVALPFVKTPTNVTLRVMDYSPIGLFTTLAKQIKNPNQRALSQGLGRAVTGSALVWLGYTLAAQDQATGASSTKKSQRALTAMQGKAPNNVRVKNSWLDISRISPAGTLVALGAQMYQAGQAQEGQPAPTMGDKVGGAGFALGRVMLDQPFLTGTSAMLDAANDPQRSGGRYLQKQAGSLIPTLVSDIAGAMDPTQREARGVGQSMMLRTPGLRNTLPPRLNAFGKPMANEQSGASAFLDFMRTKQANDDPLVQEMLRLGLSVPTPGTTRTLDGQKIERSEADRRQLQIAIGTAAEKALRAEMAKPSFAKASDEDKKARLQQALGDVKADAYADEERRIEKARKLVRGPTRAPAPR